MKVGALIAEFNPFHTGHKYIIDEIKAECDAVVVIMSGNFVQRGECAVFDKMSRTHAALSCGVDLVIELPCAYALSSAEGFALGAVDTLNASGIVDELYFGSECGDMDKLHSVCDALLTESDDFKELLSKGLRRGLSFPAARSVALSAVNSDAGILDMPNNTLAVEYMRRIKKTGSRIVPHTLKRLGNNYNDALATTTFASASALRNLLKEGKCIDSFTPYKFSETPVFMDSFDTIVASHIKAASIETLCRIPDCNEELSVRLLAASRHNTFAAIVNDVSCKSHTQSRIRRILCNLIIGNTFSSLPKVSYIRTLGFNQTGSALLNKMKSTASLDVVARGALLKDNDTFNLECRSTDIYNLARNIEGGREFSLVPELF